MKTNPNDLVQPVKSDKIRVGGGDVYDGGLTKREYFAAMALQGALSNPHFSKGSAEDGETFQQFKDDLVRNSVQFADALIVELNKEVKDV